MMAMSVLSLPFPDLTRRLLCRLTSLALVGTYLVVAPSVNAQGFQGNHNAAVVLGQAGFTTTGSSGSASQNGFATVTGVAIDPATGEIYLGDRDWNRILRFSPFGSLTNGANATGVLGQDDFTTSTGGTSATKLSGVLRIRFDSTGDLIVPDRFNHRVVVFPNAGALANGAGSTRFFGQSSNTNNSFGSAGNQMFDPRAVFESDGDLWVADSGNNRILRFSDYKNLANGAGADLVLGQAGFGASGSGSGAAQLSNPTDLVVGPDGSLWVCDSFNNRVLRFANIASLANGAAATTVLGQQGFGTSASGTSATQFSGPEALAISPSGRLYVADSSNRRILWFENAHLKSNGAAADGVLGQSGFNSNESLATRNRFASPSALALDGQGRLYVTQADLARVVIFAPSPVISLRGKPRLNTTAARVTLRGGASASAGFGKVEWQLGRKSWRTAKGTTTWSAKIPVKAGKNLVRVRTMDRAMMPSTERVVRITRR